MTHNTSCRCRRVVFDDPAADLRRRVTVVALLGVSHRTATTAGHDARLDAHVAALQAALQDLETIQYRARKVAEDISLALQGSLLVRHGHPAVAEAFLATRMGGQWGGAFGTLPTGLDLAPILERALVKG